METKKRWRGGGLVMTVKDDEIRAVEQKCIER